MIYYVDWNKNRTVNCKKNSVPIKVTLIHEYGKILYTVLISSKTFNFVGESVIFIILIKLFMYSNKCTQRNVNNAQRK